MVSKSTISRKHSLILIITGTTRFKFDRLFRAVDETLLRLNLKYQVIVQSENSLYSWKHQQFVRIVNCTPRQFIKYIKQADKIITHGGPATLWHIVRYAHVLPLVIPRSAQYKEHVDNHQQFFIKHVRDHVPQHIQKLFILEKDISLPIKRYLTSKSLPNILNKYLFKTDSSQNITHYLSRIIDSTPL